MSERRNNSERMGAPHPDADAPPKKTRRRKAEPEAPPEDDFFSFVTPTEFVDLPSRGEFYPEDSYLHGVEQLEIRHMTAKEEDILTAESLLRKGVALDRLLQSMLVDKRVKIGDLLVGDKNALLVAARITGFGATYETALSCPVCDTRSENAFNLDELVTIFPDEMPDGCTMTAHNTFVITLPSTNLDVETRLLTSSDEKRLTQMLEKKRKSKATGTLTTDLLKAFTVTINERDETSVISSLLERLPVKDSRHLRKTYEKLVPNLDMTQTFDCDSCGYEGEVTVPMTADFFWPDT